MLGAEPCEGGAPAPGEGGARVSGSLSSRKGKAIIGAVQRVGSGPKGGVRRSAEEDSRGRGHARWQGLQAAALRVWSKDRTWAESRGREGDHLARGAPGGLRPSVDSSETRGAFRKSLSGWRLPRQGKVEVSFAFKR